MFTTYRDKEPYTKFADGSRALHEKEFFPRRFLTQRRKGAKRCRVSKGFLCAFAPLREESSQSSILFVQAKA
jgi:hypothetical protein